MDERTISDADLSRGKAPLPKKPAPAKQGFDYGATLADHGSAAAAAGAAVASGSSGAASPPASPSRGQSFIGSAGPALTIVRQIGAGGMGSIFLGRDNRTRRWVAIKRLTERFVDDPQLRARFLAEAQSVAAMSHYHIVALYSMDDGDEASGQGPQLVMEYVAGPPRDWPEGPGMIVDDVGEALPAPPLDLDGAIRNGGVWDAPRVIELGLKVAGALAYAHRRGVVHRDIKPANILLTEDMEPKLTDFGLARRQDGDAGAAAENLTLAGARLLSLGFGAPEQEIDASRADARADLYALGGTLWFALTAQNPRFFRESEVPELLRPILAKAMEKDRERRFQNATEMARALEALKQGSSLTTAPTASPQASSASGEAVPGRCPHCAHVHAIDPANPLARRFCERCGTALAEPCLACGVENGAWVRFCGGCGADVPARLTETAGRLQHARDQLTELLESGSDPVAAVDRLQTLEVPSHPRLRAFAEWADEAIERAQAALDGARKRRDAEQMPGARTLYDKFDYAGAATMLEQVPMSVRTPELARFLEQAKNGRDRCLTLRTQIREMVAAKSFDAGLREKVTEFLALRPADPDAVALMEQLRRREAKRDQQDWAAAEQARDLQGYLTYLEHHPDGEHAADARRLAAPELRELVLRGDTDAKTRNAYLDARTEFLRAEDEKHALIGVTSSFSLWGMIGGVIGGAIIGAVGGPWGGAVGGLIGGAIVGAAFCRRS